MAPAAVENVVAAEASRRKAFECQHGHQCAKLDAVPVDVLRDRKKYRHLGHVDEWSWNRVQEIEDAEMATIDKLVDDLQKAG